MLRALGPVFVASVALWAAIAWCFIAVRTLTGHDHIHLDTYDFGIFLLAIDGAFVAAILWHDDNERRRQDR
ncbi:hypothetical protein [Lichenibacterium ramalinae]|uniref:Uncharacterized protein n=1 Tax=Lichenibacterium ramalinae TaxID=2316527 RepID=A0A4Q2R613_9HYPH|nr:hypothetical protein [Lichenibacterium ramalinae]RYB01792.1 hypothetical protein D3272_24160 [Lichenibacterium ramalinae]